MDGNFTADHIEQKQPQDDVFIAEGTGFGVGQQEFRAHRAAAVEVKSVSR